MSREAFEKAYHKETGLYASWSPNNKGYTDVIAGMCYRIWQAAQAQAQPIAAVHGWFHGECVIRPLDPEAVLPAGMVLYSQPQAQAGDGQAVGEVVFTSRNKPDVEWLVDEIRCGTKLYTAPPAAKVNQQLLEALQKAERHLHAMMAHIDHKPQRFQEHCWQQVLDIRATIAAAQEQK